MRRQSCRFASVMGMPGVALIVLLAGCASSINFSSLRGARIAAVLSRPEGNGPFPAMVLLPACSGVTPHVLTWADWLKKEGYAALVVYSPDRNVCDTGVNPSVDEVVEDALGAMRYLTSLPFVDVKRVGVMGFSYGGTVALRAASRPQGGGFRAAAALYPGAPRGQTEFKNIVPALLLLGEDDYPATPHFLGRARAAQAQGSPVSWIVYSGAKHGFDQAEMGTRIYSHPGFTSQYDGKTTALAENDIRAFLARHVKGAP